MLPMINFYSAFPSFIEKFVLRDKTFTIEQAVLKTSTQPAIRYGLKGRGVINEGSYADIVLLDLKKLKVNGTPMEPRKKPSGIEHVLVNGVTVVSKGKHTGASPGTVIKRGG
jgi:N-acyl-D-aspartate/D-glutamate deacylase